jgi:hypothetical protein
MALKTCPVCQGTRKIKGIGMMSIDCETCDGVGKVDPETVDFVPYRGAATPLTRDALPEDYFVKQAEAKKKALKGANLPFNNRPQIVNYHNGDMQANIPAIAENAAKLAELRETLGKNAPAVAMQKVELSPSMRAELAKLQSSEGDNSGEKGKGRSKKSAEG